MQSATDFIRILNDSLNDMVVNDRTVIVTFSKGFVPGPGRGSLIINFINLPEERHRQRRGNGAESENNRQLFMVWGFDETPESPVSKVKIEQSINGLNMSSSGSFVQKMRTKSGSPDKVASYLAKYINDVADKFPPYYTHE
jgi:hypothetical protein